jgi:uncharacterized protein
LTVFADSSALVKLYVAEMHYEAVREITEPIVVSVLAAVEVPAALWRKHRMGEISASDAAILRAEFDADMAGDDLPAPRFAVVAAGDDVLAAASEAVARHPLWAYDAVQLASALVVRRALDGLDGFVAFDGTLRAAAAAEGLMLVP